MNIREGGDQIVREAFAIQPDARPGGVDLLKVAALVKLTRQLKVVIHPKDSLNNPHSPTQPQIMLPKG